MHADKQTTRNIYNDVSNLLFLFISPNDVNSACCATGSRHSSLIEVDSMAMVSLSINTIILISMRFYWSTKIEEVVEGKAKLTHGVI